MLPGHRKLRVYIGVTVAEIIGSIMSSIHVFPGYRVQV